MTSTAAGAVAARPADDARAHETASGIVLIVLGTIAFSSAGLFVRILAMDTATVLFWRGVFTALVIAAYVAWREGAGTWAAFRAIGAPGLAIAALSAASMGTFISSLQFTTVANNSIIFGTAPFITAALARIIIGERPSLPTVLFSCLAFAGALVVMGSSASLSRAALIGDALAVVMTLTFALKTVLVRKHRDIPMVPSGCVGAVLGALGAVPFVQHWALAPADLALFAVFGITQQGLGLILSTIGIARVPAAHAALLMTLDLPMSPMWVWLAFGERPTPLGVVGGLTVLVAIVGHILIESRRRRR